MKRSADGHDESWRNKTTRRITIRNRMKIEPYALWYSERSRQDAGAGHKANAGFCRVLERCSLVYNHVLGMIFLGKFPGQAFEVGTDEHSERFGFATMVAAIEVGCQQNHQGVVIRSLA